LSADEQKQPYLALARARYGCFGLNFLDKKINYFWVYMRKIDKNVVG
jgi:hypothetical protein